MGRRGVRVAGGVRRGEVWTVSGSGYAGKPRPAIIVQDDIFPTASVTVCPVTTSPAGGPMFRVEVIAQSTNGLDFDSRVMIDKTTTVPRSTLGNRLGTLHSADMIRIDRALALFLGLAS